ncbi:MAG: flavin monoamine oxidase family protein [Terriglobia bacterium]
MADGVQLGRRQVLKLGAAGLMVESAERAMAGMRKQTTRPKKVIVAGAGIGGLSCGYELMKRGHDVVLLEAAGRAGGHVRTFHDPFADGLYADIGAEHFTEPGYDVYRSYVREFGLPTLYYPRRIHLNRFIGGKLYTEEELRDPQILAGFGLNAREIRYLSDHPWGDFVMLYLEPYLGKFKNEYKPFDAGLNHLERMTVTELLTKDGASNGALHLLGSSGSALQVVWYAAILKIRGLPYFHTNLHRIKGGNQLLPDTFAARLGERIHLGSPVNRIEHGASGVTVHYTEFGEAKKMQADYLVCSMSAVMLRILPVNPPWPERKAYAINHVTYYSVARVVFQTRTAFWEKDGVSPNWEGGPSSLQELWRTADEVKTKRAILLSTCAASSSADDALKAFRRYYPGKSRGVEHVLQYNWALDPWAMACETLVYPPGELHKIYPATMEPVGRVHFAGAYADNYNSGQDAATRSAFRVAEAIDKA